MAAPTLTPNSKEEQDDRYNPALLNEKERQAFAGIKNNYNKDADSFQENENIARAGKAENEPAQIPKSPNELNFTGKGNSSAKEQSIQAKLTGFLKKRSTVTGGIVGGLGITSILVSMMFGGFSMLVNLQSNAIDINDTRSNILERRLAKWLDKKSGNDRTACSITKYKCRMGRMPNKMLGRMSAQGITPLDSNGKKIVVASEDGYADKNPTKYEVPDGNKTKIINSSDLAKEYRKNAVFRSSFKKVYSMRYRAWVGKTVQKVFYDSFKLKQTGGVASDDKNLSPDSIDKELDARLDSSSSKDVDKSEERFRQRFKLLFDKTVDKSKKTSDPVLMGGVGYCTLVGMPGFVAGAYRAIQVAQILILVNDVVLSPAGKIKAGDATAEDASSIGDKLTESISGKSALDSAILLSAIGVNKSTPSPSKYAPGYEAYSSPVVQSSNRVSAKSKGFCNKITSPSAQITAATVEGAISVGTAGTGALVIGALKGALKAAAAIGAIDLAAKGIEASGLIDKVGSLAFKAAEGFVGNYTEGARGEKLGDALGVGLFSYFSLSGLKSGSAVLKKDQIVAFNQSMEDVENDYREEDIATLSPFDTSSKYTFMGSMVSNLSLSGALSKNPLTSLKSLGSLVLSAPSTLLSPTAHAADAVAAKNRCNNNKMFDIEDDIGVNPSGYPCVGIPAKYLDTMSVDEVQSTVADDADEDTGEIKPDGDIASIQADCSDGDLEAIGGCTITDKKRAAQSIYQYDKNVSDILDGSDDQTLVDSGDDSDDTTESTSSGDVKWPLDKKWWTKDKADWLDAHSANSGTWTSGVDSLAVDIGVPSGQSVYAMLGGKVSKMSLGGHGLEITSQVSGGTLEIAYAHGPRTSPSKTSYEAGEEIMTSGQLGNATGPHLHIDMAFNGKGVCPQLVFPLIESGDPIDWGELASKSKAPC